MMFRFLTGTRRCRQHTLLYNHNAVGEVGRQVIVRMIAVAMVFTVLGCGSDDSGAPMHDWTLEVAGVPAGASAVGEIRSILTGGSSGIEIQPGLPTVLSQLPSGFYEVELDEVEFDGRAWLPETSSFSVELRSDGAAVVIDSGVNLSVEPFQVLLPFAYDPPGGSVIAEPLYPDVNVGLYRCDATIPGSCTELNADVIGRLTLSANDRIYTVPFGKIYSCDPAQVDSCIELDDANAGDSSGTIEINAMIYANSSLYAGLSDGRLWKCDPDAQNACVDHATFADDSVLSLAFGSDRLFAGLDSNQLWSCDPDTSNDCQTLDTAGGPIEVLAYGNDRVYAGIEDDQGTLWSCDPLLLNRCTDLDTAGKGASYTSMLYANGRVYAGLGSGIVWSCDPNNANRCSDLYPKSSSDPYGIRYVGGRILFSQEQNCKQSLKNRTNLISSDPAVPDAYYTFQTFGQCPALPAAAP